MHGANVNFFNNGKKAFTYIKQTKMRFTSIRLHRNTTDFCSKITKKTNDQPCDQTTVIISWEKAPN
jgi:hypothetical protein